MEIQRLKHIIHFFIPFALSWRDFCIQKYVRT